MEQKPPRGPRKNDLHPTRTHTYRAGSSQSPENAEAARHALNRRARRKKQVRRNRAIGLLVLLVLLTMLVLGIVAAVRFFTRDKNETPAPNTTSLASLAPDKPQSGTMAVAEPEPEENPDDYTYYEPEIPILLNKYNPLPEDMQGEFTVVDMVDDITLIELNELEVVQVGLRPDTGEMHYLQPRAAQAFLDMVDAAKEDGINLFPVSGYRSHARQVGNFNARVSEYVSQGYSQQEAENLTGQLIAVPGTSEHEAGLAIDINSLDQSFEYAEAFTWLSENCNRFGFILRYEKTTFATTGIDYEPWHYRYVGENHAYAITEMGVTLEEYVASLGVEVKTATGTLDVSSSASAGGTSGGSSTVSGASSSSTASSEKTPAKELPMG